MAAISYPTLANLDLEKKKEAVSKFLDLVLFSNADDPCDDVCDNIHAWICAK